MAQKREARAGSADVVMLIPKASTDINPGDVLVMARANDPISIQAIGPIGRVRPIAAAREAQWAVGVTDSANLSAMQMIGATLYAAPTADISVRVQRNGFVYLALTNTAGKAGDSVSYSSGASGAQLFAISNKRPGEAVAKVCNDFTGGSSGNLILCQLIENPIGAPSIYYWLENRVLEGCQVKLHAAPTSKVGVGAFLVGTVPAANAVLIRNKYFNIAKLATLAIGGVASAASSTFKAKWVVARSGSFAVRSCTVSKALLASFTVAGVTVGLLRPVTMTVGEIPVALLVQFSAATMSAARIFNVRGPAYVPAVGSWGI
jgi:hypothetical protein